MGAGPVELLIVTALYLAVLLAFTVLLARRVANAIRNAASDAIQTLGEGLGRGRRTALEILDERYARGEIGREEYVRIRRDIEEGA